MVLFSAGKRIFAFSLGLQFGYIRTMASGGVNWKNAKSIYEFSALDIDGNEVSLDKYSGHVVLIVNVASK